MDSITSALESVAANNGRICGGLHYIRTNVSNKLEGIDELRDNGGIKILVKCLKQVNPKVLSLSLSILGNCSMNEACREQLFECGVIKDLVFIMKNINVDAIDNRTCRMIANLAESQAYIPMMYKHKIPSIIINILSNTKCDITRYSAIRALRKIWENSSKTGCTELLKIKTVRAVSELLTSKNKEIVLTVLRAQASFLSYGVNLKNLTMNVYVVTQIIGVAPDNVNTINTFMSLLPDQPLASKVIFLMCKVPQARSELHKTKLIMHIIDVLRKEKNYYLSMAMCRLLECPLNRNTFYESQDGINILLNLMSGTDIIQKELAINTLLHFQYCRDLLEAMVKKGLISILVQNLSLFIQANKTSHPDVLDKKFELLDTTSFVRCASPADSTCTSRPISVTTSWSPPMDDNIATDSYSPVYSPVCESFDSESINADESKSDVSDYAVEDDKNLETPPSSEKSENTILHILLHLCYTDDIVKTMADKFIWNTLLDYIQFIKLECINSNAMKILQRISQHVLNFQIVLADGFILSAHQRLCRPIHEIEQCKFCRVRNKLGISVIEGSTIAFESKFAEAMMNSNMKLDDASATNQNLKILTSVTAPLSVCESRQLISMLCRYKVYGTLCNIISDDENASFDDAVGALIAIFKKSNIDCPNLKKTQHCKDQNCQVNIVNKETTVTFALDDGTLINSNKEFLSSNSPVYEAMFQTGHFWEGHQTTIPLINVSSECFKSFLHLLEVKCVCVLPKNIDVLLELIMITDKNMLNELSEKIITLVMDSMLIDNCNIIYEWAKETGYQVMVGSTVDLQVVKYLFTSNSRFPDRIQTIKKIIRSNYGQHFIEDISTILKLGLTSICLSDDRHSKFYLSTFSSDLDVSCS